MTDYERLMRRFDEVKSAVETLEREIHRMQPQPERQYGIVVKTPEEILAQRGIDPLEAWSDDPGLTPQERSALRSLGRTASKRQWIENGRPGPGNHGM